MGAFGKNLSNLNGFEVIERDLMAPSNIPGNLQNTLQILFEGRLNKNSLYTAQYCHDRIKEVCQGFCSSLSVSLLSLQEVLV